MTTITTDVSLGVRRRFAVLAAGCVVGAVLFLPFMSAGSGRAIHEPWPFAFVASAVSVAAAWPGLLLWDRAGLPMPLLRAFERRERIEPERRALIFVLFHLTGSQELGPALTILSIGANGGLALLMGWIGARHGFEYLVLAHFIAHTVTVGVG